MAENDAVLKNKDDDVYTKDGTIDHNGNPANKNETGTWKACPFILGTIYIYPPTMAINIYQFYILL